MKQAWAIPHFAKYRVVLEYSEDNGKVGSILAEVCFKEMAIQILKDLKVKFPRSRYGVYWACNPSRNRHYLYARLTGTEGV